MFTIFTGIVAGSNPVFRIIRCPREDVIKLVKPDGKPLRGSFRLMYTFRTNGYCPE
jgi:hypothetical protein